MSGSSFFDSLGLSFADTTHMSSAVSSPVIFGAMAFGRGTAGGTSSAANPATMSEGGATAVTPMTNVGLGGQGSGASSPFDLLPAVMPFIGGEMGLNGGQVQDPLAKLALYGQLPAGVTPTQVGTPLTQTATPESSAPSMIAIGGIILVAAVGAFFLLR